jgi:nucleotide-binding universal stress UspA family protein
MTLPSGPIMICYDGSQKAVEALEYAVALFPGTPALVVTVWKPIVEELLATAGAAPPIGDPGDANERQRSAAKQLARQGASRASKQGVAAVDTLVVETIGPIWEAIEEAASGRDARLIICGTDRSGLRTSLPGSVASALFQNASRPVLVKPSAAAVAARQREFTSRKVTPRRRRAKDASEKRRVTRSPKRA